MMKQAITLQGVARFHFIMTRAELLAMQACAEKHYDSTCKGYADGWLASQLRWMDSIQVSEGLEVDIQAEFRDLDIMCKIMEGRFIGLDDDQRKLLDSLQARFSRALSKANQMYKEWTVKV